MLKPYKTFFQQIVKLSHRGMFFEDTANAEKYLSTRNYSRLNYYFHKFMTNDNFGNSVSFNDIIHIEETDSEFRHLLFRYIEFIELKLRTQIAYFVGQNYGSDAFYYSDCFISKKKQEGTQLIQQCKNKILLRFRKDPFIKHHCDN